MHREQARQLIGDVLEGIHGEGSVNAYKDTFDPPQGYETAWNALLAAIAW